MKTLSIILSSIFLIAGSLAYGQATPGARFQSQSFQYLNQVLTSGSPISNVVSTWNGVSPSKFYSVSVTTTASNWVVELEGSLDNVNWQQIAITNSALGVSSNTIPQPMLYLRLNASTIASNTSVTATAIGVPY